MHGHGKAHDAADDRRQQKQHEGHRGLGEEGEGQLVTERELYERLERALPLEYVVQAVGYGSGVFSQRQQQKHPKLKEKEKQREKKEQRKRELQPRIVKGGGEGGGGCIDGSAASTTTTMPRMTTPDFDSSRKDSSSDDEEDAPLVDMIVVVNDAAEFHRQNFQRNPDHYPSWASWTWTWLPPPFASRAASSVAAAAVAANRAAHIQRHSLPLSLQPYLANPGAYYVIDNGQHKIKYGVVHKEDLSDDLRHWTYLYLAGRMHKPTVSIYSTSESAALEQDQRERNLPAALGAALLLLSDNHSGSSSVDEADVYRTVAGLSYAGDFRMRVGAEDPDKVRNLVHSPGSLRRFRQMYRDAARNLEQRGIVSRHTTASSSRTTTRMWTWDGSDSARQELAESLPPRLRRAAALGAGDRPSSSQRLQNGLRDIVAPAARYQSVKGLFTAGSVNTSIKYAVRKLRKGGLVVPR